MKGPTATGLAQHNDGRVMSECGQECPDPRGVENSKHGENRFNDNCIEIVSREDTVLVVSSLRIILRYSVGTYR